MSRPDASSGVFWVSAVLVGGFVLVGAFAPDLIGRLCTAALQGIAHRLGWFYILSVTALVGATAWLGFGPYAHVRLGQDDERPEFSTRAWFAMLFSAGMGIGLVFYGVAEPILHYTQPPQGPGGTLEAAQQAMVLTYFHWGIHAWCIYVVAAVSLAYFSFRQGLPLTISSALHPFLGDRIHGPWGRLIDVVAVFGTLFGLATSLGLGAMQVNAGLAKVFGAPISANVQLLLIAVITSFATVSVVTGLHAGVRRLSELNMLFATVLLAFVFLAGPTVFLLDAYIDNLGAYLQHLVRATLWRNAYRGSDDWHASWTIFYWGWWIAWSPFVGTFIARVSRGRTIRELVLATAVVPVLITFGWLTVFGNSALYFEHHGQGVIAEATAADASTAIFALLDLLPMASIASILAVLVIVLFFVTSSDSGSLVVDMLTSGGDPNPPISRRIFWALTEGLVAAVLLVSGGLKPLQAAAIATGLPFCGVLLSAATGLIIALHRQETPR